MKFVKFGFLLVAGILCVGNVFAGTASSKLSGLAGSLIKGYSDKFGTKKSVIAIFPLNCDDKLQKQRVGFAASEIMSHKFVASKTFTVVERGDLDKLLTEQKLQSSGVVESETAVRLGKILGAGVILVGNVQKVGGKYQVNARLVNAETSEVLCSGYEELNSSAFEDDAKVYLNLVPEEQTLGIYFAYNYRSNPNKLNNYTEYNQALKPQSFSSGFIGGGILYKPIKNLLIDVGGSTLGTQAKFAEPPISGFSNARVDSLYVGFSYVKIFALRYSYRGGIGFQKFTYPFNGVDDNKSTKSGVFLKGGLEFKPQSRFGVGLSVKYDLEKITAISKHGNKMFELNQLSYEPTISFYF